MVVGRDGRGGGRGDEFELRSSFALPSHGLLIARS